MEEKLLAAKSGAVNMLYASQQVLALANGTSQFVASPDLFSVLVKTLRQRIGEFESSVAPVLDLINAANCDAPIVSIAGVSGETAHSVAGKIGLKVYHVCRNVVIHRHEKTNYQDIREAGGPDWEELLPTCWGDARKLLNGVKIEDAWLAQISKECRIAIKWSKSEEFRANHNANSKKTSGILFPKGFEAASDSTNRKIACELAVRYMYQDPQKPTKSRDSIAREIAPDNWQSITAELRKLQRKGLIEIPDEDDSREQERE